VNSAGASRAKEIAQVTIMRGHSGWGAGLALVGSVLLAVAGQPAVSGAQDRPQAHERPASSERPAAPDRPAAPERPARAPDQGVLRLLPGDAVSEQTIAIGDRKLTYTATAGTLPLFDQSGEQTASVFYTAYVAKGGDSRARPLTFAFNGGPGAASAYLHLGLVGPKILDFGADPRQAAAARLRDNPDTWLDFTDLVLIDPIGTGWSRTAKPDGGKAFWGVRQDADVLAKVIALYVARNNRLASPKYLLGESYGGFRAAKVARALPREQGLVASGILMLSPMLEGALQFGGSRFALGAALHLPSLAAAQLERSGTYSEQALAEVERFALTEYLTTLTGPAPQGAAARAFYARLALMTGLPEEVVEQSRGFVRDSYLKRVREGKIASAYDAAFTVDDPFPESDSSRGGDPVLDGFTRAYAGAFVGYAREDLGFRTDMTYMLLNSEVNGNWDWGDRGRSPPSAGDDLRVLLAFDPSFRLLIAHGASDIVTPFAASRYVLDHLPPLGGSDRALLRLYRGGHMFYVAADQRRAFTADARTFFQSVAAGEPRATGLPARQEPSPAPAGQ
jgi:carboxypeptidase C (cathepsin A)